MKKSPTRNDDHTRANSNQSPFTPGNTSIPALANRRSVLGTLSAAALTAIPLEAVARAGARLVRLAGERSNIAGGGAAAQGAVDNDCGRLQVDGNKLVYKGQPIRLRGVVIGDLLYPNRPAAYDFKNLRYNWNANVVRLSVHPGYWEADPEASNKRLQAVLAAARAEGIFVIICWKAIGFPDGYMDTPKAGFDLLYNTYDTNFDNCRSFWRQMARQYGSDGGVLFELFNEPAHDPKHLYEAQHWGELRNYWTILLKQDIRPAAQNVVICAPGRWAFDLSGVRENPVPDSQVAYAWHDYPARDDGHFEYWPDRVADVYKDHPMIVTEWGFREDGGDRFYATPDSFGLPLIKFMEDRGMSWTAYSYSAESKPDMLEPDWTTLTSWGTFAQSQLRQFNQVFSCST